MTKEEYKKLTSDYVKAFHEYDEYLEQFFTTHINGELINKATKFFTTDELDKIDKLKQNLDRLQNEWLEVARSNQPLID